MIYSITSYNIFWSFCTFVYFFLCKGWLIEEVQSFRLKCKVKYICIWFLFKCKLYLKPSIFSDFWLFIKHYVFFGVFKDNLFILSFYRRIIPYPISTKREVYLVIPTHDLSLWDEFLLFRVSNLKSYSVFRIIFYITPKGIPFCNEVLSYFL